MQQSSLGEISRTTHSDITSDDVPRIMAKLASSFLPLQTEHLIIYYGTGFDSLDRARVGKTIGIVRTIPDLLDDFIKQECFTSTALAINSRSGRIGIYLETHKQAYEGDSILHLSPGLFIAKEHILTERPLPLMLTPVLQELVSKRLEMPLAAVTDEHLREALFSTNIVKFGTREIHTNDSGDKETVYFIPSSIDANNFVTEGSCHPTRSFVEPIYQMNQFQDGRFIGDVHLHRVLTPDRIAQNPAWYSMLMREFGDEVQVQNMLSLPDIVRFRTIGLTADALGLLKLRNIREFGYAFREIYVADAKGRLVAHSVVNFSDFSEDQKSFQDFLNLSRVAAQSSDPDIRLELHRQVKKRTRTLRVDQPLSEDDYYPREPAS